MNLTRRIRVQLVIFTVVTLIAATIMAVGYMQLPALLFGVGHYKVTVELPRAAGLYKRANVTYRGTEVGRVTDVQLTATGVAAVLSLDSNISIPADLQAEVHSQSAVGEQYVALLPRSDKGPLLTGGAVIPLADTTTPPDISALLDATNRGLQAIPHESLNTTVNESYTAVGGLGPEISRIVKGSTTLATDARQNLDALTTVIEQSKPILDSQIDTSDSIQAWAAHLATISGQLQSQDTAVSNILDKGPAAAEEARSLIDRLQPLLPVLLANLVSVGDVALTYRADLEQVLVLVPQIVAEFNGILVPDLNTKLSYKGAFLSFALNLNLPPPCTTGYLPIQQQRPPAAVDYPDRPAGDLYCRIPQDSPLNVRGMRNLPCETRPGKRAPTVKMCESDENYVPLNDGFNWKGDPNATLSGQGIPQLPPGASPRPGEQPPPPPAPAAPMAIAEYDPATGTYIGPDGHKYTQGDLSQAAQTQKKWQDMLTPPPGG
jgi:phospholipid/cholesterol/gamma-HCH transport system substrate-binding protein